MNGMESTQIERLIADVRVVWGTGGGGPGCWWPALSSPARPTLNWIAGGWAVDRAREGQWTGRGKSSGQVKERQCSWRWYHGGGCNKLLLGLHHPVQRGLSEPAGRQCKRSVERRRTSSGETVEMQWTGSGNRQWRCSGETVERQWEIAPARAGLSQRRPRTCAGPRTTWRRSCLPRRRELCHSAAPVLSLW